MVFWSSSKRTQCDYDLVVVGSGSAGLTAARFGADLGARVLLIEKRPVLGGDCTWNGCVPSKALIAAGHAAYSGGKRAKEMLGITAPNGDKIDGSVVGKHIAEVRQRVYEQETPEVLRAEKGIEIEIGEATFSDSKISVNDRTITYYKLAICTGSAPNVPESLAGIEYDTNETIFDKPPTSGDRLAVIGGGPIGAELAQACGRLGAAVFVIARRGLLPRERVDARSVVEKAFAEEGIQVIKEELSSASQGEDGTIHIVVGGETRVFDRVLVAAGRKAVVPSSLTNIPGVKTDKRGIVVSKTLMCAPNVYAAGDCISGGPQFTHVAGLQGFYAARNSLLPSAEDVSHTLDIARVPRVTYTSPEVGSVGLADRETAKKALGVRDSEVQILKWTTNKSDRALTEREDPDAFVELVVVLSKKKSVATIVGGTVVGERAGEMLSEIAVAAQNKLTTAQVGKTIHPYPTFSFVIQHMCSEDATERFLHYSTIGSWFKSSFTRTNNSAKK